MCCPVNGQTQMQMACQAAAYCKVPLILQHAFVPLGQGYYADTAGACLSCADAMDGCHSCTSATACTACKTATGTTGDARCLTIRAAARACLLTILWHDASCRLRRLRRNLRPQQLQILWILQQPLPEWIHLRWRRHLPVHLQ